MAVRVAPAAAAARAAAPLAQRRAAALRGAALAPSAARAAPRAATLARRASPRAEVLPLPGRTSPLQTARDAATGGPLSVFNTAGEAVSIAELTRGKTVVALLRHFG
jgi:hypothetical protein